MHIVFLHDSACCSRIARINQSLVCRIFFVVYDNRETKNKNSLSCQKCKNLEYIMYKNIQIRKKIIKSKIQLKSVKFYSQNRLIFHHLFKRLPVLQPRAPASALCRGASCGPRSGPSVCRRSGGCRTYP